MSDPGENVRRILRQQGRSQRWLGRLLGYREDQICHWLSGRRAKSMPSKFWDMCALALQVPVIEITRAGNGSEAA